MSQINTASDDRADAAPLFAALGDTTRLTLVDRLSVVGPQSITQLTAGALITRHAITKHLTVLAAAGLVRDTRQGRERIWALEVDRVAAARHYLDRISQHWDEALMRLKAFVEE